MNASLAIFQAEFKSSTRRLLENLRRRFTATIIILFIAIIFSLASIRLIKFIVDNPSLFPEGANEGYGSVIVILFAIFTLRSAGSTYRKTVKSRNIDIYLSQPILPRQILNGMLLSIIVPSFIVSISVLFSFIIGNFLTNTKIFIPFDFVAIFLLFSLLAPICGFLFSIVGSLHPFSRKIRFLFMLSPILLSLIFVANYSHFIPSLTIAFSSLILFFLLILCYFMDNIFIEAIESHRINSSSHRNSFRVLKFEWLNSLIGTRPSSICSKEVTSSIRERDVLSSAISTFSIAVILVFWWFKVGIPTEPIGDLPSHLYYPGMIAISLYMGSLLQCTMLGSTVLGVEGKRLWIVKSNPVESNLVMRGKATALIIMAVPGLFSIWLPICLLAGFPAKVTLFFGECLLILLFCNTGLGIWAGSAFANFDESERGNPDILVQFMLMGTSGLISTILLVLPATVMLLDHSLGLFAGLIFCIVSFGFMIASMRSGASAYRSIYIDSYGS